MIGPGGGARLRNQQRWLLWVALSGLVVPWSMAAPARDDRVAASASVSVAFFATILTGEAVIFAIAFSASSAWPSLREIDAHIAFREWVVIGWLGAMLLGTGMLLGVPTASTCGAVLFLVADLLGIFSFVRLFELASAGGRRRLLRRTLERRLAGCTVPVAGMAEKIREDDVLAAYLRELDAAVSGGDGNVMRDLSEELAGTAVAGAGARARAGLHFEVLHRVSKAVLTGRLDSSTGMGCADRLVVSLLDQVDRAGTADGLGRDEAAAVAGHLGRYLAWLSSTSRSLAVRQVTSPGAAREVVAFCVRARDSITFTIDPDPPRADSDAALGSVIDTPLGVVTWIRAFVEFHGSAQANAFYPAFELLTGTKFEGNYWDGASVLTELRERLFSTGSARVHTEQAERARSAFGSVEEFDRLWTLVSAAALATLRDATLPHPPELVRPEFTPDPLLLRAYLRTWATHRYLADADHAYTALLQLAGRTDRPTSLWARSTELLRSTGYPVPLPEVRPRQRLAAGALAIACRLAPLSPGADPGELRAFLERLPAPVLESVQRLCARVLPQRAGSRYRSSAVRDITARLTILQHPVGIPAQVTR